MSTNEPAARPPATIEEAPQRRTTLVPTSGGGLAFMPQNHRDIMEVSQMLAQAKQGVPVAFRDNPGMCAMVVYDAIHWGMLPPQVIRKAYVVKDQLAYESQLIHAVVNTRAGLKDDFEIEYIGEGVERQIKVTGCLSRGSGRPLSYTSPKLKDIKVKNSPLWTEDPDRQLFYYGTRAWARMHVPEVLMGVYAADEIIGSNITPTDRIQAIDHMDDDLVDDPNVPGPEAPIKERFSWALEQVPVSQNGEGDLRAVYMKFVDEVDAVGKDERTPLRRLYESHLRRVQGKEDAEKVFEFSRSFRPQKAKQEAA